MNKFIICANPDGGMTFVKVPSELRDAFFNLVAYKIYFGECENLKMLKDFKEMVVEHDKFTKDFYTSLQKALNTNKNALSEWQEKLDNTKFFEDLKQTKEQVNHLTDLVDKQSRVLSEVEQYLEQYCQE